MCRCIFYPELPLPDDGLLQTLDKLSSTAISDVLGRVKSVGGLRPVGSDSSVHLAGPVITVRTRPGDNLVVHKAIDVARPGEVLFVDAGGYLDRAVAGEVFCRYAETRGVRGLVVDGAVRDAQRLGARPSFPVFARGVTAAGPYHEGSGEIRGTVTVGGVIVHDGDLIVADVDGIVVLPRQQAARAVDEAAALESKDVEALAQVESGTFDHTWVDALLEIEPGPNR